MVEDVRFIDEYLGRIGYTGEIAPTLEVLREIQFLHVTTVPFENLDIMDKIPLALDIDHLFEKIVLRRRGGICYEQNLLLGSLLKRMGYEVVLLSSRHPKYQNDFDHVFLMVDLEGRRWLADVGFADNSLSPLLFEANICQSDGRAFFKIIPVDGSFELVKTEDGTDTTQFIFTLKTRQAHECYERCDWFATSPNSRFTKGRLVTLDRPQGRITLVDERLIITKRGQKAQTEIVDGAQFDAYLGEYFNIFL
jgi:N-hydroxyarylamine O-acetyltransferase